MFKHIYIEADVKDHPVTQKILRRLPAAHIVECERYGEIFNRKAQNFRLQKLAPALILARKHKNHVLAIPDDYSLGAARSYYFSHMLNCLYDCRYCFLQGMYRSAHYVLFINYDDFKHGLQQIIDTSDQNVHFFSGYDCDSLALEPVSGFVDEFLPFFAGKNQALLELRTKSTQIRPLLRHAAVENCVIAFSLSPQAIVTSLEHKTPSLEKRLNAIIALQDADWPIGLRFDPVIYTNNFEQLYENFLTEVFKRIHSASLHSVTLGSFRLPNSYFRTISRLYPDAKLFASGLHVDAAGMIGYAEDIRQHSLAFCRDIILRHIPPEIFFPCEHIT